MEKICRAYSLCSISVFLCVLFSFRSILTVLYLVGSSLSHFFQLFLFFYRSFYLFSFFFSFPSLFLPLSSPLPLSPPLSLSLFLSLSLSLSQFFLLPLSLYVNPPSLSLSPLFPYFLKSRFSRSLWTSTLVPSSFHSILALLRYTCHFAQLYEHSNRSISGLSIFNFKKCRFIHSSHAQWITVSWSTIL